MDDYACGPLTGWHRLLHDRSEVARKAAIREREREMLKHLMTVRIRFVHI